MPISTAVQSPSASSGSSYDFSPRNFDGSNDSQPVTVVNCKSPIIIQRGSKGFGFSIKSVRVYMGNTEFYTIQHIVSSVDPTTVAYENGLRTDDLITHVNGSCVENVTQPELLQKLICSGDWLTLKVAALDQTTIKKCDGFRGTTVMARIPRRACFKHKLHRRAMEHRKKASLFRRLSGKRVSAELSGGASNALVQSLHRSISSTDGLCADGTSSSVPCLFSSSFHEGTSTAGGICKSALSPSMFESTLQSHSSSSGSSRPCSLHGLKQKLSKPLKIAASQRKEVQSIPLSPLARCDHHQQQQEKQTSTITVRPQVVLSPSQSPLASGLVTTGDSKMAVATTTRSHSFKCTRPTSYKKEE
ncbi:PDZ domain containing protein [Trichuris trichiura]|uniref:PDZ domain containing protein n=1 Tax=Trichuris trichiura TaxID=36087 RepID=A0A077ZDN3_TRITR|nr:PDZ domain containing protein [Trichuris trichiura]